MSRTVLYHYVDNEPYGHYTNDGGYSESDIKEVEKIIMLGFHPVIERLENETSGHLKSILYKKDADGTDIRFRTDLSEDVSEETRALYHRLLDNKNEE